MIRGFQWVAAAAIVGGSIIYLSNNVLSDRDQRKSRISDKDIERSFEDSGQSSGKSGILGAQSERTATLGSRVGECTGTPAEIISCEQAAVGIEGREAPFGAPGAEGDLEDVTDVASVFGETEEEDFAGLSAESAAGSPSDSDNPENSNSFAAINSAESRDEAVSFPGAPESSADTQRADIEDKIVNDAVSNDASSNDVRGASAAVASNWAAQGQRDQELAVIELETDEDGRITSGKRVPKELVNGRLVDKPDNSAFFTENKPLSEKPEQRIAETTTLRQPGKALVDKLDDSNFFTENQRLDPCLREDGSVYAGPGTAQDPLALENPCLPITIVQEDFPEFTDPCLAVETGPGGSGPDGAIGQTAPSDRIFPDGEDPCLTRQDFALTAPPAVNPFPLETETVTEPDPAPERVVFDAPLEVREPFLPDQPRRPPRLAPPYSGPSYRVDG